MSLFRHALINSTHRPFPKTIRYKRFAVAGISPKRLTGKHSSWQRGYETGRPSLASGDRSMTSSCLAYTLKALMTDLGLTKNWKDPF
jgi:hypothetical protein